MERQRDSRTNGVTTPKTRSSSRSVPLGRIVVDELAAHLAAFGPADDFSIFMSSHGQPMTNEAWKPVWRATGTNYKTTTCGTTRPAR